MFYEFCLWGIQQIVAALAKLAAYLEEAQIPRLSNQAPKYTCHPWMSLPTRQLWEKKPLSVWLRVVTCLENCCAKKDGFTCAWEWFYSCELPIWKACTISNFVVEKLVVYTGVSLITRGIQPLHHRADISIRSQISGLWEEKWWPASHDNGLNPRILLVLPSRHLQNAAPCVLKYRNEYSMLFLTQGWGPRIAIYNYEIIWRIKAMEIHDTYRRECAMTRDYNHNIYDFKQASLSCKAWEQIQSSPYRSLQEIGK